MQFEWSWELYNGPVGHPEGPVGHSERKRQHIVTCSSACTAEHSGSDDGAIQQVHPALVTSDCHTWQCVASAISSCNILERNSIVAIMSCRHTSPLADALHMLSC
jgi:hypothetical protein